MLGVVRCLTIPSVSPWSASWGVPSSPPSRSSPHRSDAVRDGYSAFSETLGLSPKMLARIARVQRALALARTDTLTTWSAIAASSGYFDQSHLVRDFRQLVGCLPSEFDPSRLPITDAFVES
jgi:hypothetical protein